MATIRTDGKPGELNDTQALSAVASPVHRNGNGRTKTEGQGPNHSPARVLADRTNGNSADRSVASALHATSLRFTLVAALSLIELIYYRARNTEIAYVAAGTCLIFIALALQTSRLHRAGFLTALSFFAMSTTAIAVVAMTTEQGIGLVIKPLIAHLVLMASIYRNFETREDLQLVENRQ